ncbi:MAG: bifunctional adenosylcobinamide kinase/adenosylcobinamide-phosphate guanylyltransferase [Acidimicrobiia bacterium]
MITLVLGGVRSGKSEVAERLAGAGPLTYLATGLVGDDDFAVRVARHRERRPAAWSTVEEPRAVPEVLHHLEGTVLLDAVGTWLANDPEPDLDGLVAALTTRAGDTIVVSEEVGLGVHPVTEVGRRFADTLGEANRRLAEVADRCLLVVAGRVVELPPSPSPGPAKEAAAPAGGRPAGGFRSALAFLTPLGGAALPGPGTLAWLPVVGVLLGLGLGGLWWGAEDLLGPLAGAAVVVAADLAATGALHFDGLVDSADGLLPHLSRRRRLLVMAKPGVGAFGIAVGAVTLLLRTAALATLTPRPLLLAALWSASRWSMALCARSATYARPGGLATSFLGGGTAPVVAGVLFPVGLALADRPSTLAVVALAIAAGAVVHELARRRIGGFTGDTLGAAGVTAETTGLLAALAVA